jgi:hypothetical protein
MSLATRNPQNLNTQARLPKYASFTNTRRRGKRQRTIAFRSRGKTLSETDKDFHTKN